MRIGKRLFPYPILNNNLINSHYKISTFTLNYNVNIDDEIYRIENIYCDLTNEYLKNLIIDNKATIMLIIECPVTMFRKKFVISTHPKDILIPLHELSEKVYISAFIVATQDIDDFRCDDFLDDYAGYSFSIEKYDILAVDDGYYNSINFEPEDGKKNSIFEVIKDFSPLRDYVEVKHTQNKVIIVLPDKEWDYYNFLNKNLEYQDLNFAYLAIPALTNSIQKIKAEGFTLEELKIEYNWFNSFIKSYEKLTDEVMTDESFEELDVFLAVQKVLNSSILKAIKYVFHKDGFNADGGLKDED